MNPPEPIPQWPNCRPRVPAGPALPADASLPVGAAYWALLAERFLVE
ncbi:MAG: hypothetical protein IPH64_03335 [Comamonadaceae bacterium]|nr:hypothetical protein [Comamonadaceae bacterium]